MTTNLNDFDGQTVRLQGLDEYGIPTEMRGRFRLPAAQRRVRCPRCDGPQTGTRKGLPDFEHRDGCTLRQQDAHTGLTDLLTLDDLREAREVPVFSRPTTLAEYEVLDAASDDAAPDQTGVMATGKSCTRVWPGVSLPTVA